VVTLVIKTGLEWRTRSELANRLRESLPEPGQGPGARPARPPQGACRPSTPGGPPALVRLQAHMVREVQVLFRHALSGLN